MKEMLARGAGWIAASRVLINLLGFASTLLLARLLAPADFGIVAIATTVAAIAASLTELSLSSALVHHEQPDRSHYDTAWTLNAFRASLLSGGIAALAVPLAALYGDRRLIAVLLVTAAINALGGFGNPKLVMFTRQLVFHQEFVMSVAQKFTGFIAAVGTAYYFHSYWALVAGAAAGEAIKLVLSYALLPYYPRLNLLRSRELLSFSIWLSLGQVVQTLNNRLESLVVGFFLGSATLGNFTVGGTLAYLPTQEATAPIARTLFPAFAHLRDDAPRLRLAYQKSQALLCAIAVPLGCGFAVLAEPIVLLLLGDKWRPTVIVIQFLASMLSLLTLANSVHPLAMALGQTKGLFQRNLINFAIQILLLVPGLYYGRLTGVLISRLVGGIITIIIDMAFIKKLLNLSLLQQLQNNLRCFISVATMVGILILKLPRPAAHSSQIGFAQLAMLILLGGATYILTTVLLWIALRRPDGPEQEIIRLASKTLSGISSKIGYGCIFEPRGANGIKENKYDD